MRKLTPRLSRSNQGPRPRWAALPLCRMACWEAPWSGPQVPMARGALSLGPALGPLEPGLRLPEPPSAVCLALIGLPELCWLAWPHNSSAPPATLVTGMDAHLHTAGPQPTVAQILFLWL